MTLVVVSILGAFNNNLQFHHTESLWIAWHFFFALTRLSKWLFVYADHVPWISLHN